MDDRLSADDWESTLSDLRDRRVAGRLMGGEERLTKHRAAGKLDARARVADLFEDRAQRHPHVAGARVLRLGSIDGHGRDVAVARDPQVRVMARWSFGC